MEACVLDSPVGHLLLQSQGEALTLLERTELPLSAPQHPLLCKAKAELESYFSGTLHTFSLPLRPQGTPFQQAVWAQLLQIPYGETRSYGDLARALGKPALPGHRHGQSSQPHFHSHSLSSGHWRGWKPDWLWWGAGYETFSASPGRRCLS